MKMDILCSDKNHPVYPVLLKWKEAHERSRNVNVFQSVAECKGGDLLFLISCNELVKSFVRSLYKKVLVIHASDLPAGRGWSPLVWQVLEGKTEIVVTLFEAVDKVDDGPVWTKTSIFLEGHELVDEINKKLFSAECELMTYAVEHFDDVVPKEQAKEGITFYRKRTQEDSRIDPDKTFREQFNLLRIADPDRYPAFMDLCGHRYKITIEKMETGTDSMCKGKK